MNEKMKDMWEIIIAKGLGAIGFGRSRDNVAGLSSQYGEVSLVYNHETRTNEIPSEQDFEEFLSRLGVGDLFSQEEIETSKEAQEAIVNADHDVVEERRKNEFALSIEYEKDRLYAITTDGQNTKVHHEGRSIFGTDAKQLLQHFQNLNGGARVHETDVLFDKIGLLLTGLYYQNEQGAWRFYSEDDEVFEDRFVTVFDPSHINKYLTDDFVEVDFFKK